MKLSRASRSTTRSPRGRPSPSGVAHAAPDARTPRVVRQVNPSARALDRHLLAAFEARSEDAVPRAERPGRDRVVERRHLLDGEGRAVRVEAEQHRRAEPERADQQRERKFDGLVDFVDPGVEQAVFVVAERA